MKYYRTLLHSTYALALGALLAVGLNGCTADELVDEPATAPSELGDVTVFATLGQGVGTRTGLEEVDENDPKQGIKVSWVPGDAIKIVSLNEDYTISGETTFTFAGMTANNASGIFKGKAEPASSTMDYMALYPARVAFDEYGFSFDMTGQTQWGNGSMAHLGAYDAMYSMPKDWKNFSFADEDFGGSTVTCHINALMTFDLKGIPADLGRPQSITLGCTSAKQVFWSNIRMGSSDAVSTLELKLTGFATPADGTTTDIKAHMMIMGATEIPEGESLTITVRGTKNSYTFTSAPMEFAKLYSAGKRYTASVGAGEWTKVLPSITYTGAEAAEAFTGSGTSAADPYVIATAGQLRTLIEGTKTGSNFSTGKFYRLGTNINIAMAAGTNWTPIGTKNGMAFCGTFDGDGHTISGTMTGAVNNFGFFGYLSGATIMNLTIDATVESTVGSIGGVAGNNNSSNASYIINCINKGKVTSGGTIGGGIMGNAAATYIFGCINEGEIYSKRQQMGGIAGYVDDGAIVGCYNTATVTTGSYNVGGIAGYIKTTTKDGIVTACYNTGKIVLNMENPKMGAIVGSVETATSTISYCQYVLNAANTGLSAFYGKSTNASSNLKYDNLAGLNGIGVANLNSGIMEWNNAHPTQPCSFHFVPGTATTGPTLEAVIPD